MSDKKAHTCTRDCVYSEREGLVDYLFRFQEDRLGGRNTHSVCAYICLETVSGQPCFREEGPEFDVKNKHKTLYNKDEWQIPTFDKDAWDAAIHRIDQRKNGEGA